MTARPARVVTIGVLACVLAFVLAGCVTVKRVDVRPDGTSANNNDSVGSGDPALDADGSVVAFTSWATDLGPACVGAPALFVRDVAAGQTECANVNTAGVPGGIKSESPALSADGRYVVFQTDTWGTAGHTDPGPVNGSTNVYRRDRVAHTTTLVSAPTTGAGGAAGPSAHPSISADGRYVAFTSYASNLVSGDTNQAPDIFVRDMTTGTTVLASLSSSGTQLGGTGADTDNAALSADGRYVAFTSSLAYAQPSQAGTTNVFVRDLVGGTTRVVSVTTANGAAGGEQPSISGNGRYVAFRSDADALDNVADGIGRVYVRDLVAGTTTVVSTSTTGVLANGETGEPLLSTDGNIVVFTTSATNLVPNGAPDDIVFRDLQTGKMTRLNATTKGVRVAFFHPVAMSGDGKLVAFASLASNLVPDDDNNGIDMFVRSTPAAG